MTNRSRHPLGRLPLLDGASDAVVERLASLMTPVRLPAGRVLVHQGAPNRQFVLIEEGTVRVERAGQQVAVLGPGEFVGELSLLGDGTATATVTTTSEVAVYVSNAAEFASLLDSAALGTTIADTAAERTSAFTAPAA